MTVNEFFTKYDNKESFSEEELEDIIRQGFEDEEEHSIEQVDEEEGENERWIRYKAEYIRIDDRYFCFGYYEGLTELQPNEYTEQPYEVRYWNETKTIIVTHWERVNRNGNK